MRDVIKKETVRRETNRNPYLNESLIFQWTVEIFDALAYLHSLHVIHRNIKPEFVTFLLRFYKIGLQHWN